MINKLIKKVSRLWIIFKRGILILPAWKYWNLKGLIERHDRIKERKETCARRHSSSCRSCTLLEARHPSIDPRWFRNCLEFNDFLLDRDPIRSGKNRRIILYSLGSEVYTKIFFLFFFFIRIFFASKKILVQKLECKNRMLNRFVREICVYFFYLYSKCIRVCFFLSFFFFFFFFCIYCVCVLCISV